MATLPQYAPTRIYRAAVEALAHDEQLLRERLAELEHDVVVYRDLLQQALDRLHELHGRERVRQRRLYALIEENRKLRGSAPRGRAA